MASLVIAAAGAAIGSTIGGTFLGMSAAQLGWMAGSFIGSTLFSNTPDVRVEGPRLSDLSVTSSHYGRPIPRVWGVYRAAGNMIWSTPIVETRHESGGGGKGGGSVTTVSYTYAQSFAMAVADGPITGIRRIWANGKLIYNVGDTADAAALIASNQAAAGLRIYTGTESQTADSLIQADVGTDDTPAYRGTAYVVFDTLQLADYGNRTPNIECEVIVNGSMAGFISKSLGVTSSGQAYDFPLTASSTVWNRASADYNSAIQRFDLYTGVMLNRFSGWEGGNTYIQPASWDIYGHPFVLQSKGGGYYLLRFGDYGLETVGSAPAALYGSGSSVYELRDGTVFTCNAGSDLTIVVGAEGNFAGGHLKPLISYFVAGGLLDGYEINGLLYSAFSDYIFIRLRKTADNTKWLLRYRADRNWTEVMGQLGTSDLFLCGGSDGYLYFINSGGTQLRQYDDEGTLLATCSITAITGSPPRWCEPKPGTLLLGHSTSMRKIDLTTMTEVLAGTVTNAGYLLPNVGMDGIAFWMNGTQMGMFGYDGIVSTAVVALSEIVADVCESAGLAAADIDVTDLTTTDVLGYAITQGTARGHLEALLRAYFVDAVESSGKLKFVRRGKSVAATIDDDDMAAHDAGSDMPDLFTLARADDLGLPAEISLSYADANNNYQVGTQYARRLATAGVGHASQSLAIALTPAAAKKIADVWLYDAWAARTRVEFATGWKWAHLEPTDIISVNLNGRSHTLRITEDTQAGGICTRAAVVEDASAYTQSAAPAASIAPEQELAPLTWTRMTLMDIPLLRDQDDGVGFYAAVAGYSTTWRGAVLFKSADNKVSWQAKGSGFMASATMGVALTKLADFNQYHRFDETNSVSVQIGTGGGGLASDSELAILNGANAILLGNELLHYKTATLTATSTYTLSGLLRGQRGTEWACSQHDIGERLVVLSASSIYLINGDSDEYNLARHYRAVTFGALLDDSEIIKFTHANVAGKPYSPVHLGGGRNAAGDITLTWIRRARKNHGWVDYWDVPQDETVEQYEVDIYTDNTYATLKRTIAVTGAQTATYSAADQTTDFGSPRATLYWKVCKLSPVVGRGYEATGVI